MMSIDLAGSPGWISRLNGPHLFRNFTCLFRVFTVEQVIDLSGCVILSSSSPDKQVYSKAPRAAGEVSDRRLGVMRAGLEGLVGWA
jgi:hypothetical protein